MLEMQPQLQALIHSSQEPTYVLETDPMCHDNCQQRGFHVQRGQFKGPNNEIFAKIRKW